MDSQGRKEDRIQKPEKTCLNSWLYFAIFVAAVLLSTLLADGRKNALWGTEGKLFGTVVILLCCGIFAAVAETFTWNAAFSWSVLAGTAAVSILTILSRFGADPMHMYDRIDSSQVGDYLGTIGQKNIVSGVLCLFVAVVMGCFVYAKDRISRMLFGIGIVTGVAAGICANSDSFFLGMVAAVLYFLWAAADSREHLVSYYKMLLCLLAGMLLVRVLCGISTYEIKWSSLHRSLLEGKLLLIMMILILIIGVLLWWKRDPLAKADYSRTRRYALVGTGALAVLGILMVIIANAVPDSMPKQLAKYLVFSDSWGTNRGYVWSRTLKEFGRLPLLRKLIGVGPGGFFSFFSAYYEESAAEFGYYFVDAHNDFLQYLVTTGILGLIGYVGMIGSSLYRCLREQTHTGLMTAAVLIVWLAQGIVNNPLVFTTPYLFFFLGVSRRE